MRLRALVFLATLSAAICCAQPRIDLVQNNYRYLLPGNPNYGIAQGSIFIIKGANLASTVGLGARLTASGLDYLTAGNQCGIAQSAECK